MTKSIGQAAYETWRNFLAIPGQAVAWDRLPPTVQRAWERVATAAISQHIDNRDEIEQGYPHE